MVVGFITINQFSVDFVTSVHVCPKNSATHATLSLKVWGMREVVSNEMNLHCEVFTVKVFAVVCEVRRRQLLSMIWWEIEGFLLTVGDGCRKLGGHGREMILRRDGDSRLVNVEFKSELQWCKSPMLRDLTGLVTHENSGWAGHSATADVDEDSDVAGYSAAAIEDEKRAASSTIELPSCEAVESHTSTQVPFASLCRACIVGRGREAPQPFHLGGAVSVSVTTPIESLEILSPCLKDRTSGEDNTHTIVPSDSNTMSNLGLASILTEDVRVHGAWSEFLNKFPDRKNVTFEETDGGLDRSHESLGAAFKTRQKGKHTVDDCVMYRDDWNGLQRHEQRVFVWIAGAQDEDPWEYNIAPRKGPVPQAVRGVYASLQELSYLRVILNQNFQTQLIPCTSPVDDHASNRAAETVLAPSAQKGKRSST